MDIWKTMEERHSVRSYTDKPIEQEKRDVLDRLIRDLNRESGFHIQILYDEPKCFDSFLAGSFVAHYGRFIGVCNYICLVGKKSRQLDEQVGYYGEQIVLAAQQLGLNTCWVALTHGKSMAKIGSGEAERCLIAIGYGETAGRPRKSKSPQQVSNYREGMPEWFLRGVKAALLAPTAMNQQKFYFELKDDGTVKATHGTGFYAAMDLGIAKYHFEAATGKTLR